jgi:hypothetical protein
VQEVEDLLSKLSRSFHKNHFLLLSLKQDLLNIYRRELMTLNPQKKFLHRMLCLYEEIIDVLEIVEPGISRLKGNPRILFPISFAIVPQFDKSYFIKIQILS